MAAPPETGRSRERCRTCVPVGAATASVAWGVKTPRRRCQPRPLPLNGGARRGSPLGEILDPDPAVPRLATRAFPRPRSAGAALRRAFHRRGARPRQGQAVELPAHLQARDRPARGHRPLQRRRLRQGGREPAAHDRRERARPRRASPLLRLSHHLAGAPADGACLRRRARGLRERPHQAARAHHAHQGDRPRAPDRGAQRPDRPGHDGLPACARDRHAAEACHRARSRRRRHRRRRGDARAVGDRRRRAHRRVHARLRRTARRLHRRRPPPFRCGRARIGGARRRCLGQARTATS